MTIIDQGAAPEADAAFDVADVDHVASDFTDLNFIVEHVGLHPERRDTCEDDTQHSERLAQQAQRNAQAERAAALAVDASV